MGCSTARGPRPWACRTLLLLLLLLWGAAATALPLEGSVGPEDSVPLQEVAEIQKNSLLTFLAWWNEWTSQASTRDLTVGDVREVAKRQESPPLQRPPRRRDKTPCKNFFWKTFSCK